MDSMQHYIIASSNPSQKDKDRNLKQSLYDASSAFCFIGNATQFPIKQKALRGMRTRAKKKYVASDRARRENVPRHILFIYANKITPLQIVTMKFTTNHSKFPVKFPTDKKQLRFENTHVKLNLYAYVKFE